MTLLDKITEKVLAQIDDTGFTQSGAFNLRHNGIALCHGDSEHIKIKKKQDKPGIDIFIDGKTDGEEVHIPVVVDASGMTDVVYNDFYVAEGANVTIVAGCGIHNSGCNESRHDGIHTFHVEKNANVRYVEKHYGEGEGTGARVLNPVTEVYLGENSVFTLDTAQIKGVDSTVRENNVHLEAGSKLYVIEKLMTHGKQEATSNMMVELLGEGSSAQIVSRSVAKGESRQVFHPRAVGKNRCHAHVQCDSIIMDHAEVSSIPEINAKHVDAAIIHEAAIGRINDEQLIKLRTLGMTEEEAERLIKDEMYYGVMMVKMGEADGMVGGAVHSTGDMLRPALQIVKTAPGINTVSGFFIMNHPQKTEKSCFLFADCAVTPEPTSEQLVDIAVCSEKSARVFLAEEPKIALLSFSTKGSAKHPLVEKVQEAARMIKEKYPELPIDGELQADAALVEEVGQLKAKGSKVAGHANVFIFPDLNAGNISYKLVQRLGGFDAYGPICQGFAKPINDLSRGCNVDDIVGTVALTAIEASIN